MKLYLDDLRTPYPGWVLVKTAQEAIKALVSGEVTHISLDHDLGDDDLFGTGYDVIVWIEEQVFINGFIAPQIQIHTANVSGRVKMEAAKIAISQFYP